MKLLSGSSACWTAVAVLAGSIAAGGIAVGSVLAKTSSEKHNVAASSDQSPVQAKPTASKTARQIDQLLAAELFKANTKLAPRIDDATYLRRVWLDIVG